MSNRMSVRSRRWILASVLAWLSSCSGNYSGGGNVPSAGPAQESFSDANEFFAKRVQPRLEFCRSCHLPGGVGDTDLGQRMMLSGDKAQDLTNFQASWTAMGGNNPVSRILLMASGQQPHSGGSPWPQTATGKSSGAQGGGAYGDVSIMLTCFEKPGECAGLLASAGGADSSAYPLLGTVYSRGVRQMFCEGADNRSPKPDSALIPQDPRTMILPGVNAGKAVHFNAWWENCKVNLPASDQPPKTCGEYRKLRDEGRLIQTGGDVQLQGGGISAEEYNDTWKKWGGFTERPDNFDELYTLRYGTNSTQYHNPYPIRKKDGTMEDPNAPGINGGSGRLPIDKIQGKDADGKWTGQIVTVANGCAGCHAGQVGIPGEAAVAGAWWGIPNNNADALAVNLDSDPDSPTAAADQLTNTLNGVGLFAGPRGLNDASTGYELLAYVLYDWDSTDVVPDPAKHPFGPNHGRSWQDSPSWFHQAHHARKFKSGEVSVNAHRMTAAACLGPGGLTASGAESAAYRDFCGQRLNAFHESLEAPDWPRDIRPIDTKLAEAGAILFHTKNLWAHAGNANRAKPEGNGSCAGCHGAYSPRFVNDPAFLSRPELEGMASYIVPMEIIGSEIYRHQMTTTDFADSWNQSWWSYPEGQPGYVAPGDKTPAEEQADDNRAWAAAGMEPAGACQWAKPGVAGYVPGYLAPSLYGIWATGPYMHNGSVPTLWQMLDSTTRPTIWRRKTQKFGSVEGFDQSFATGYDFERIGWKYDELKCEDYPNDPNLGCNPVEPAATPPLGTVLMDMLQGKLLWTGLLHPQYVQDPDLRFVRDARHTGNGNEGHEFANVLTDAERKAIIEYLKTL